MTAAALAELLRDSTDLVAGPLRAEVATLPEQVRPVVAHHFGWRGPHDPHGALGGGKAWCGTGRPAWWSTAGPGAVASCWSTRRPCAGTTATSPCCSTARPARCWAWSSTETPLRCQAFSPNGAIGGVAAWSWWSPTDPSPTGPPSASIWDTPPTCLIASTW